MDNFMEPAYPFLEANENGYGDCIVIEEAGGNKMFLPFKKGFTKLELAALMIAQGMAHKWGAGHARHLAEESVVIAKIVLEEANKNLA